MKISVPKGGRMKRLVMVATKSRKKGGQKAEGKE